ncbi:MAG: histidine phosphatase family protein [Bdellovibrionales bacterium]|nr:histidine phosphatase family protein [Bdellovibrionales bacterium]
MNLLIIRHAIAEDIKLNVPDKDRPLSQKGSHLFHTFCQQIHFLDLKFEFLLSSPLLRAKQTARIFSKYFPTHKKTEVESLLPSAEPESFLTHLSTLNSKSVVLVGHQPFLNSFIQMCLSETREFIILKRGSMVLLNFPGFVKKYSAILKFLLDPKYLK